MRTSFRKASVACGAAFASIAVALSAATPGLASNSALVVGGIATPKIDDMFMKSLLGGTLTQPRISVQWPAEAGPYTGYGDMTLGASISLGITSLEKQIDSALGRLAADGEKVTVVGLSAGSLVVNEVLRKLVTDADAPDKDDLTFVLVADSSRQKLINSARYNSKYDYTYQPAAETKYDVIVVTGEYDGMADLPDRWWNMLAVVNALAGGITVHVPVMFKDYTDEELIKMKTVDVNSVGGTTTNILMRTEKLPLVQLMPWLAPREAELKAKIDKGYSRNDVFETTALRTAAAPTPAPAVVEEVAEDPAEPVAETDVAETTGDVVPAKDDAAVEDDVDLKDSDDADVDIDTELANDEAEAEAAEAADTVAAETDTDNEGDEDSAESDSNDAESTDSTDSSE